MSQITMVFVAPLSSDHREFRRNENLLLVVEVLLMLLLLFVGTLYIYYVFFRFI